MAASSIEQVTNVSMRQRSQRDEVIKTVKDAGLMVLDASGCIEK